MKTTKIRSLLAFPNFDAFPRLGIRFVSSKTSQQVDAQRKYVLAKAIQLKIELLNDLVHRNMGRGLINFILRLIKSISSSLTAQTVRTVVYFTRLVFKLWKNSGNKGVVNYLKCSQVLLQQSTGGFIVEDLAPLKVRVKRSRRGLPHFIPSAHREKIRSGDLKILQLWMTLLGLYRVLSFRGSLQVDTITRPRDLPPVVFTNFVSFFHKVGIQFLFEAQKIISWPTFKLYPITTSSPTSSILTKLTNKSHSPLASSSLLSLWQGALLWIESPIRDQFKLLAKLMDLKLWNRILIIGDGNLMPLKRVRDIRNKFKKARDKQLSTVISNLRLPDHWELTLNNWLASLTLFDNTVKRGRSLPIRGRATDSFLGKLSLKFEPAGKVRVFALVDAWTQWLLRPIHLLVFDILKTISDRDGTFDQSSPVLEVRKNWRGQPLYSLDLSAATDRLPIAIQSFIVSWLYQIFYLDKQEGLSPTRYISDGAGLDQRAIDFGSAWRSVLVDRFYELNISKRDLKFMKRPKNFNMALKYAVGQPMGALSSWAMLALTHHFIVMWSAYRVGKLYFKDYAILGDDIVIADKSVAMEYQRVLNELGVKCGLAKSVIAENGRFVVEFAKKFFVDSGRADMIPFKDYASVLACTRLSLEFARKWDISEKSLLTLLGFGYRSVSKYFSSKVFSLGRLKYLLIWFQMPNSLYSKNKTWLEWISMKSYSCRYEVSYESLKRIHYVALKLVLAKIKRVKERMMRYESTLKSFSQTSDSIIKLVMKTTTVRGDMIREDYDPVPWFRLFSTPLNEIVDTGPGMDSSGNIRERGTFLNMDLVDSDTDPEVTSFLFYLNDLEVQLIKRLKFLNSDDFSKSLEELLDFLVLNKSFDALPSTYWSEKKVGDLMMDDILSIVKIFNSLTAPLYQDLNLKIPLSGSAMVENGEVKKVESFRSMVDLITQPTQERIPVKPDLNGPVLPLRKDRNISEFWIRIWRKAIFIWRTFMSLIIFGFYLWLLVPLESSQVSPFGPDTALDQPDVSYPTLIGSIAFVLCIALLWIFYYWFWIPQILSVRELEDIAISRSEKIKNLVEVIKSRVHDIECLERDKAILEQELVSTHALLAREGALIEALQKEQATLQKALQDSIEQGLQSKELLDKAQFALDCAARWGRFGDGNW